MRLFVSIDFPESTLEEIHSWIPKQKGWKRSSVHQMHLTLVFLGECSEKEKDQIHAELAKVEFDPFEMVIEGLGAFPNESSPRIIWAGVQENEYLHSLQQSIFDRLKGFVQSKHTDEYIPHITIARKKSSKGINHIVKQNLKKGTGELQITVDSFHLKQSILKPGGSEHKILHTYS